LTYALIIGAPLSLFERVFKLIKNNRHNYLGVMVTDKLFELKV